MLRLSELRLDLDHTEEDLEQAVLRCLRVPRERLISQHLVKRSIDARRRDRIRLIYSVDVNVRGEKALLRRRASDRRIRPAPDERYRFVARASSLQDGEDPARPVVIGAGPCGYFAALLLAQMGFRPLLLERGQPVKQRSLDTFGFWRRTSDFQPESNAQFGEGGAGTFSDGKLYSQVSDPVHYGRKVLEELVECGANRDILTLHRPHIGTFKLATVVRGLRAKIEALGGRCASERVWSVCFWSPQDPITASHGGFGLCRWPMAVRLPARRWCSPLGIRLAIRSPCWRRRGWRLNGSRLPSACASSIRSR